MKADARATQIIGEVMEVAETATTREALRHGILGTVRSRIRCESALWGSPRVASCAFLAADEPSRRALDRFSACPPRYDCPERHEQIRKVGGVAVDLDIFSARERDRLPLYSEILRPGGIRTYLACEVAFRGMPLSFLVLMQQQRGAGFTASDQALLRTLRGALGIVEAAWSRGTAAEPPLAASNRGVLTPRESQVASLVVRGLQNKEIATVLGTSPETVRKQTSRIYAKTGAMGRVHLAVLLSG